MKQKRTCNKCHKPITKTHRWRTVWHKFLWLRWTTTEHRDCARPEINPSNPYAVKRLKGERPLPFPEDPADVMDRRMPERPPAPQMMAQSNPFMDYEEHA